MSSTTTAIPVTITNNATKKSYTNKLRFDYTAEQIASETEKLIADNRALLDRIAAIPENERSFDSVVVPLALDEGHVTALTNNLTFPSYVSTSKEVRDASTEANKKLEEYEIEAAMREDVYKAVSHVRNNETEFASLSPDQQRLLTKMMRTYERYGLNLPLDKREQLKAIKTELSALSIEFSKNIAEDKTELLFTREQLEGLPADYFEGRKMQDDKYVVTLKYPDIVPIYEYAKKEATRKELEGVKNAQCKDVNAPIMEKAVRLRQAASELMGYPSHAHFVLADRMAKQPQNVLDFLTDMKEKLTAPATEELKVLLALKQKEKEESGEAFDGKINAWDMNYYSRLLKETKYEVDNQQIKQYFPVDHSVASLLSIAQDLFGLRFEEVEEPVVWHPEVRLFNVFDAESNSNSNSSSSSNNNNSNAFVGQFYMDLFPREGKYTHAAAFPLQPTFVHLGTADNDRQHAVSAMVCNFTRAAENSTQPALLTHSEVVTLYHEFGHLCHGFCSKAKYARFSGTSVERDFVECPSQLMENWCWEREALQRISRHHQSNTALPEDLISRLIAAKNVNAALFNLRQLFFGFFDMKLHTVTDSEQAAAINTAALYSQLRSDITLIDNTPGTNPAATFAHLMGGYDAAYYGYMWSQVFSADIFGVFKQRGIFNNDLGKSYRQGVLEQGGMQDGDVILRQFLGRDPSNDAFLASIFAK